MVSMTDCQKKGIDDYVETDTRIIMHFFPLKLILLFNSGSHTDCNIHCFKCVLVLNELRRTGWNDCDDDDAVVIKYGKFNENVSLLFCLMNTFVYYV